jgi:hypothetical protein
MDGSFGLATHPTRPLALRCNQHAKVMTRLVARVMSRRTDGDSRTDHPGAGPVGFDPALIIGRS